MIKMIVCDMDGTLLAKGDIITKRTKDLLIKCQEEGIMLVLASGRPTRRMLPYAKELQMDTHDGHLLYVNGIGHYDMKTGVDTLDYPLSIENQKELFTYFKDKNVELVYMSDDGTYSFIPRDILIEKLQYAKEHDIPETKELIQDNESWIGDYTSKGYSNIKYVLNETSFDKPMNKLGLVKDHHELMRIMEEAQDHFKDKYWIGMTLENWVEIMNPKATKKDALVKLAKTCGIQMDEIVAFGDGENDLSMLQAVGIGVAMGNALQSVTSQVEYTTTSNNEDGIAVMLEELLAKK